MFAHSVSHDEHEETLDNSYRLPSFFAIFNTILHYQSIGVCEDKNRRLKAHPVLASIARRFDRVPVKACVPT